MSGGLPARGSVPCTRFDWQFTGNGLMSTPHCRYASWVFVLVVALLGSPGGAEGNGWEHGAVPFKALVAALRSESTDMRARAAESIGYRGETRGTPPLLDLLGRGEPSHRVRSAAYTALGRTGMHEAAAPLLARLRDAEPLAERAAIVGALAQLRDPSALDALLEELESVQDGALRVRITIALGAIRAPSAHDALIRMLRDPLPAVQFYAIRGLRELGQSATAGDLSRLYQTLAEGLSNRSSASLKADAPAVLTALGLQVEILRALTELDARSGAGAFVDGARSPEIPRDSQIALRIAEGFYERRRMALHGLGYSASRDAVEVLEGRDGLGHADPRLRAVSVRSLAVLNAAGTVEKLLPVLRDPVPEVRWTAAMALGRLASADAVEPLVELLADEFGEVRRQAALALGYIGEPEATVPLARLAINEPVASVREAALYAMDLLDAAD